MVKPVTQKKIYLDKETDEQLDRLAMRYGATRSYVVRNAIGEMYAKEKLAHPKKGAK